MKRKLLLRGIGSLVLILCAVLMFGATSSMAVPLSGVEIGHSGPWYYAIFDQQGDGKVYGATQYTFEATNMPNGEAWDWVAFCVEGQSVDFEKLDTYYLKPFPNDTAKWEVAEKMMDAFHFRPTEWENFKQYDFQIAIWHQLDIVKSDISENKLWEQVNGGWVELDKDNAMALLSYGSWGSYDLNGKYALAENYYSQNFGTRVPEPGTILLLGAGLIGLVGFRRFRKR